MKKIILILLALFSFPVLVQAQKLEKINLNEPELGKGKLLMQALNDRKSERAFSDRELSLQDLSNLLWAADGINRPEEGKRTAPSAMNKQEIDVYVILKKGIYFYDAKEKALLPVVEGDYRSQAGTQAYVATAPVNLIYVSNLDKLGGDTTRQEHYSGINTGYISQNVYLYCASANLATVARGSIDKETLAKTLKLKPGQAIILGQTVGYPAEK
jgi:SagB-type dehydrogenase family enzyme